MDTHVQEMRAQHTGEDALPDGLALGHKKNKTLLNKDPIDVKLTNENNFPFIHIFARRI